MDPGGIAKRKQYGSNRTNQCRVVSARKIGSADRSCEQGVTDKQIVPNLALPANLEADSARAMSWRVMHTDLIVAKRQNLPWSVEHVDWWQRSDTKSKHRPLFDSSLVEEQVVVVQVDRYVQSFLRGRDAGHVIDMGMGEQNGTDREPVEAGELKQGGHFIARVDKHGFPRSFTGNHKAVLEEWSDRLGLDYHRESP